MILSVNRENRVMAERRPGRPPPHQGELKTYARATKGNIEMDPILKEYIDMRERIGDKKKNKIKITFKKLEQNDYTEHIL